MPGGSTSRDDALHCERIVRSHARTFALASYFLPAQKRRAAFALYAFCRVADDIVDDADGPVDTSAARQLAAFARDLRAATAGRPSGPVFRELAWVLDEYGVPVRVLEELLDGVARDLRPVNYATWADLGVYCEGVASTVGEMCTYVFGVTGGPEARDCALRYARTLGVAMQLTNILRDVGEDATRGRCYLPHEDLERFGISAAEVLNDPTLPRDPRWRPLMQFQVARARALYEAAAPGIALLSPDAQRCATACARGYAGILGAIEANGYDTVSARARLGHWARVGVLWDVWRGRGCPADPAAVSDGPVIQWDGGQKLAAAELVNCA
jgi:phytoene synthase